MEKRSADRVAKIHPFSPVDLNAEPTTATRKASLGNGSAAHAPIPVVNPARALALWASADGYKDRIAFTFLNAASNKNHKLTATNRELWTRSGGVARELRRWGAAKGDRVLLVYPPGLDFVAALIACFRLGVTAVPAYPPNPKNLKQQAAVLGSIAKNAGASIALTDSSYIWVARYAATYAAGKRFGRSAKQWMSPSRWLGSKADGEDNAGGRSAEDLACDSWPAWLHWYSTSDLEDCESFQDEQVCGTDVAFLQYTSGSTSAPKGVMITYSALSHNIYTMIRISNHNTVLFDKLEESGFHFFDSNLNNKSAYTWIDKDPGTIVSWLPQYHDMGLIGHLLTPLLIPGMRSVRMSPFTFLKNPLSWAEAITKYKATVITAPDFGYSQLIKYALAAQKKGDFQVAQYDFSHLRLALNGAGMIKYKTMRDFYFLFRHAGLPSHVFGGGFGLAEHCVYVSHGGETVLFVDRGALSQGQVIIKTSCSTESDLSTKIEHTEDIVSLVSCGRVNDKKTDIDVSIVDPSDCSRVAGGCIGEIWISSPSKTGGYWNKEEDTRHTFCAQIKDENQNKNENCKEYLRTGDLGFIWQNELYFVSRMKDLIVVHGRNVIPDDVELVIAQSHTLVRTGCVAAFQTEEDVMCAVAEVRSGDLCESEIRAITNDVMSNMRKHNISLHALQLLKPRTIPKTTSGKVRRSECRQRYLENKLDVVHKNRFDGGSKERGHLNVDNLSSLGFGEARSQVLGHLLLTAKEMGLDVNVRDNLMDSGMDSSLMVGLHNSLEDIFGCVLPPSLLLDHGSLDSVASFITLEIFADNDDCHEQTSSQVEQGFNLDLESEGNKQHIPCGTADLRNKEEKKAESFIGDTSTVCMILYFLGICILAMRVDRVVDGISLSLWKQEPSHFFQSPVRVGTYGVEFREGFFGRKLDTFHTHFLAWVSDVLPLYLITGLLLFVARRIPWITRRWSPAAVTVGVSLFQVLSLHGISAFWSFGSMFINLLVSEYTLHLARRKPSYASRCRWLIWATNLSLIALNKAAFAKSQSVLNNLLLRWPKWVVFGWCRKDIDKYNPHNALKYLVLRQLSYSLDVLEEVSREKKRKKTGPRKDSHSSLQYWAYILYAPLFMHGPVMLYHHFRSSPAANVKVNALGIREKTENPSQRVVLSRVVHQFTLTLGRLSSPLSKLFGLLALIFGSLIAMQTFYMPSIFFLKIHDNVSQIVPMNLQGSEYFVNYHIFTLAVFLQSYVVFELCRMLAMTDETEAPKDVLQSYLRSSVSVQTHWNNFHVSWRQFFIRYIVMEHKEMFQKGYLIDFVVFMFSAFLHLEGIWLAYFFYNFVMYQIEKVLLMWRSFKEGDHLVRGVYQSILLSVNIFFFPALMLFQGPEKGQIHLSTVGVQNFFLFGVAFFYLNSVRMKKNPDSFI